MLMLMIHMESRGTLKTTHTNTPTTLQGYIILLCAYSLHYKCTVHYIVITAICAAIWLKFLFLILLLLVLLLSIHNTVSLELTSRICIHATSCNIYTCNISHYYWL